MTTPVADFELKKQIEHFKLLREAWESGAVDEHNRVVGGSHSGYAVKDVPGVLRKQKMVATAFDVAILLSGFVISMDLGMTFTRWERAETQRRYLLQKTKTALFKLVPLVAVGFAAFDDQSGVRSTIMNSIWPPAFQSSDQIGVATFLDHRIRGGQYSWKQLLSILALVSGVIVGCVVQNEIIADREDDQKKLAEKKWEKTHYIEYYNDGSGDYASYDQWNPST